MKILQINKFYYLRGGSETHFFELVNLLEAKGHQVIPWCMQDPQNRPSEYEKYFIKPVNLEKFSLQDIIKYFYNYEALKKLEQLIKHEKPEVAHLHNIAHQFSPAIIRILKKHQIPIVQTLHDYKLICPNYKLFTNDQVCLKCQGQKYYNCLANRCVKQSYPKSFLAMLEAYVNNRFRKLYEQIDLFIAPSQFMKKLCIQFGINQQKLEVVNNFLNFDFSNLPGDSRASENYILYFGRLAREKGIDTLIQAMLAVRTDLKLKIVGDGPELSNLNKQIKQLALENRITISKQIRMEHRAELEKIIKNAQAVILPSVWYENMPYSLIEAMAMAKTVIVSDLGGLPELVKHNLTGLLFRSGDATDLAQKINSLTVGLEAKFGAAAQQAVKSLNPEDYYSKLLNIYKKLTDEA